MPTRLAQASIAILFLPIYAAGAHVMRIVRGYTAEPLITVAAVYLLFAGLLAVGLIKRSRAVWIVAVIFTAVGSVPAGYFAWRFACIFMEKGSGLDSASAQLVVFHVAFLLSFVGALVLLLTPRAKVELHGT